MGEMTDSEYEVERKDEVADFRSRNAGFFERLPNLQKAEHMAFSRRFRAASVADQVVFFLGRLCVDDFLEILLLLSNGFGIGGMKILRGMYEKAVTAHYLSRHPEKAEDFLDYHWVAGHKLGTAIERTWGHDCLPEVMKAEVEQQFQQVREKFTVADCKTCKTRKLHHSWSTLDFVSMAHEIESLRAFIVPAYYLPTAQAHSTSQAVLRRLKLEDETITYSPDPQRDEADRTLMTSHSLLINVLDLQQTHFKITEMESPVETCMSEFFALWKEGPTRRCS